MRVSRIGWAERKFGHARVVRYNELQGPLFRGHAVWPEAKSQKLSGCIFRLDLLRHDQELFAYLRYHLRQQPLRPTAATPTGSLHFVFAQGQGIRASLG